MMRKSARTRSKAFIGNSALERIVEYLIETAEPSRLFEFYYWCQEAELLNIVRACAALPEPQRHLIASFFAAMEGNELISANWKEDGQLVLCCQSGRQPATPSTSPAESESKRRAHRQ